MTIETVLERMAERGTPLTLDGQFEGGEFETYAVFDGEGRRWVLKTFEGEDRAGQMEAVVARVDRLRAKGYPAPARGPIVDVGCAVAFLQEFVPGTARDEMTHALLDRVLELNQLQAETGDGDGWAAFMQGTLVEGLHTWSRHEPPREYSPETRALVEEVEAIGREWRPAVPEGDLVHLDFHHRNLLRDDVGALTAVVDWEGVRPGDRNFDLVTLAFAVPVALCEPGVENRLWEHLRLSVPADTLVAYVAHMALRLVDFSIRVHPGWGVDLWLGVSERQLARVR